MYLSRRQRENGSCKCETREVRAVLSHRTWWYKGREFKQMTDSVSSIANNSVNVFLKRRGKTFVVDRKHNGRALSKNAYAYR